MTLLSSHQMNLLESLTDEPRYISRFNVASIRLRALKLARLRGDGGLEITTEGRAYLEWAGRHK